MDPEAGARLGGLLLAGGGSTRMGRDKARLDWDGEPLARRVLRALDDVADEVVVASGDGRRLGWLGRPQVADAIAGAGPLGGLVAGLEEARHPLVAVLAVDLPHASAGVLRALAGAWAGEPAVVPVVDGRAQPLHAVWARTAAPALRRRLVDGRRGLLAAACALGARLVGDEVWGVVDPTGRFATNVNTPADLP